jgi:hypothetical protein
MYPSGDQKQRLLGYRHACMQRDNFQFFLLAAMGIGSMNGRDSVADYYLVINGEECTPCRALDGILQCALS